MERAQAMLSDKGLLERCREGDLASRESLARACLQRVRKTVALIVGSRQDRDDIAQTALMRIFAGLGGFRMESAFTTWVDKVTVNTVREYMRRKPLLKLLLPDSRYVEDVPESHRIDPSSEAEARIVIDHLAEALTSIKPKKRIALVLSAAYGYSATEIAELSGCSVETAKKRLQHGRRDLLVLASKRSHLNQWLKEDI